jgi:hypothetical protein
MESARESTGNTSSKTPSNGEAISITNAQVAHSQELPGRAKRYLISMLIRTACFIGAVLSPSPYRWFLIVGAVVLPYFAVIIANAGRENVVGNVETVEKKRAIEF